MRYNVHPLRAVRHRIVRHIGVLVCAVLVTVLGLPSNAQAQAIGPMGVTFEDNEGFEVTWSSRFATSGDNAVDNWIVRFTEPDGDKVVLHENITALESVLGSPDATMVTYDDNDLGTWWIQVDACFVELPDATGSGMTKDVCPDASLEAGTAVGYTHGPPAAPKNLTASLVPGGVALTWTAIMGDRGIHGYQYRQDEGDDEGTWKTATGGAQVILTDPGEYTFMLRARGTSDNDLNTAVGADEEAAESNGVAASVEITVPTAAPTLPEIAALFLALLLLGSGAYLIRRRETLTPA